MSSQRVQGQQTPALHTVADGFLRFRLQSCCVQSNTQSSFGGKAMCVGRPPSYHSTSETITTRLGAELFGRHLWRRRQVLWPNDVLRLVYSETSPAYLSKGARMALKMKAFAKAVAKTSAVCTPWRAHSHTMESILAVQAGTRSF